MLTAVYGIQNESHSSAMYGEMPVGEMIDRVRKGMGVAEGDFISDELPTLHRQIATVRRDKPRNLVIVLEESLGATFVQSLGGLPVTPELEKLKGARAGGSSSCTPPAPARCAASRR